MLDPHLSPPCSTGLPPRSRQHWNRHAPRPITKNRTPPPHEQGLIIAVAWATLADASNSGAAPAADGRLSVCPPQRGDSTTSRPSHSFQNSSRCSEGLGIIRAYGVQERGAILREDTASETSIGRPRRRRICGPRGALRRMSPCGFELRIRVPAAERSFRSSAEYRPRSTVRTGWRSHPYLGTGIRFFFRRCNRKNSSSGVLCLVSLPPATEGEA
jgi:hypothetical protein